MDTSQQDSADILRKAITRCRDIVGAHVNSENAIMCGLAAGCRDSNDIFLNLFSSRDVKYHIAPNADKLRLSVNEFGALVRSAVRRAPLSCAKVVAFKDMEGHITRMERALVCTLSEQRQLKHWDSASVRLATMVSLYYDEPIEYVNAAVWGTVRADKRRVEDLHERMAHDTTPLMLLVHAIESLVEGL